MRSIFYLSIVLIFLCLGSCKTTQSVEEEYKIIYEDRSYEPLFKPVRLHYDSTLIFLSDYFDDRTKVFSAYYKGQFMDIEDGVITIKRQPELAMDYITVGTDNGSFIIPVVKSTKRKVSFVYVAPEDAQLVQIKGEMNGWNVNANPLEYIDGAYRTTFMLEPGDYQYIMVIDGKEILDEHNEKIVQNNVGGTNNVLNVAGSKAEWDYARFISNSMPLPNNKRMTTLFLWNNRKLDSYKAGWKQLLPEESKSIKRSHFRAYYYSDNKIMESVLVPLEYGEIVVDADQLTRHDLHNNILYNVFVDRFNNGDISNDRKNPEPDIHPRANHHGGDIVGVTEKIEDGYFDALGVNTIWISPVVRNPLGAYGKYPEPETRFSAYHGYWPISFTKPDSRLTTEEELKEMVATSHKKDYNVLLDFVANHVHEEHPYYKAHPEVATNLYLPDGSLNTERWDDHRLTTWFDVFMPSLDLTRPEVYEMLSDSAVYWLEKYDFDGFRHDATKHVPNVFWRALTEKVKVYQNENNKPPLYQIGETYGTPELISSYIGNGLLDAQFDFNLYDALVATLLGAKSVNDLRAAIDNSLQSYGQHHLMGNITGNQDRARFISYASGDLKLSEDTKYAGWNRTIEKRDDLAFKKMRLLNAMVALLPGLPVIFYGDEIGMPGGNDPDNRKMMSFESSWEAQEQALFNSTAEVLKFRAKSIVLNYGTTNVSTDEDRVLYMIRSYLGSEYMILFNFSDAPYPLSNADTLTHEIKLGALQDGKVLAPWDYVVLRESQK